MGTAFRPYVAALVGAFAISLTPGSAEAQKRVALVIGNSDYQHTVKLPNPTNDARDVAAALKKHGFQVLEGLDLDKAAFDRKVRDFANALRDAEVGVLFYAGHGLQVAGQNYLVPIDAELKDAAGLDFETIRLDIVHRAMERQTQTNILFLDACRDNPLSRNLARALGTRSTEISKGLAAVESGVGTLISFSTQPGNVATDGAGRNSPFAGSLARNISDLDGDLGAILIAVRNDVMKETQRKQVPWEHSALTGQFYFKPRDKIALTSPITRPAAFMGASAGGLFTEDHAKQVRLLGEEHRLPIPDFRIEAPGDDVPDHLRRFIGIWIDESGAGRIRMLIATRVDKNGKLDGWWTWGPPLANARRKYPANFFPVAGTITEDTLRFTNRDASASYRLRPTEGGKLDYSYVNPKAGETGTTAFRPIWTLVEAEQAAKR
jgi:hypothetical protein